MSGNRFLFCLFLILILSACRENEITKKDPQPEGSFFSITRYAEDQYHILSAQPYLIQVFTTENGKEDSSLIPAYKMDWKQILKPFFEGDISAPAFQGRYLFSTVDDNASVSRTYYYEAKESRLFTRSLQITTDPFTGKIKSIYMEAEDEGFFQHKNYKLFYKPAQVIQVQIFQSSLLGKNKTIRKEYRFL